MSSEVQIVNFGLVILGEDRITSLTDDLKPARSASAVYEMSRDSLLAAYDWTFAKARAELPALVAVPLFQFGAQYQIPADCLRLTYVSDRYVGADLTDYRSAPTEEYVIEGRKILTNFGSPLPVRYVSRVTDTSLFHPNFAKLLSCQIAVDLCEDLTQSDSKWQRADAAFKKELRMAVRANAIESPPTKIADDEWVLSRL